MCLSQCWPSHKTVFCAKLPEPTISNKWRFPSLTMGRRHQLSLAYQIRCMSVCVFVRFPRCRAGGVAKQSARLFWLGLMRLCTCLLHFSCVYKYVIWNWNGRERSAARIHLLSPPPCLCLSLAVSVAHLHASTLTVIINSLPLRIVRHSILHASIIILAVPGIAAAPTQFQY